MSRSTLFIPLLGVMLGCADPIGSNDHPDATPLPDEDITPTGKVTTVTRDDSFKTLINATSATDWIYVNFHDGSEAQETGAWELRFQRFHVSTNGGVSGSAGVQVAAVSDVPFAAMTKAPDIDYLEDAADDDDEDTIPEYALDQGTGWYDYDDMTHVLTPFPLVWAVKAPNGTSFKFEILKYYDTAGTSGWMTLHWAPL